MSFSNSIMDYFVRDAETGRGFAVSEEDLDRFAANYGAIVTPLHGKGYEIYPPSVIRASAEVLCDCASLMTNPHFQTDCALNTEQETIERTRDLVNFARYASKGEFEARWIPQADLYRSIRERLSTLGQPYPWPRYGVGERFPATVPEYSDYFPVVRELYATIHKCQPVVDSLREAVLFVKFAKAYVKEIREGRPSPWENPFGAPERSRLLEWINACSELTFLVERCTRLDVHPYSRDSIVRGHGDAARNGFSFDSALRPKSYYERLRAWYRRSEKLSGEPSRFFAILRRDGKIVGVDFETQTAKQFYEDEILDGTFFVFGQNLLVPSACAVSEVFNEVALKNLSYSTLETICHFAMEQIAQYYAFRASNCLRSKESNFPKGIDPVIAALWSLQPESRSISTIEEITRTLTNTGLALASRPVEVGGSSR